MAMKKLSIEEKAKRYDEAIKRANELNYVSDKDSLQRKTIEHILPELKYDEEERIKQELILMVKLSCTNGDDVDRKIAWIEKQGVNKLDDDVEPKFKVGDKIISTISNIPYYITEVCNGHYLTDVGCIIMFNAQDNFELSKQNSA